MKEKRFLSILFLSIFAISLFALNISFANAAPAQQGITKSLFDCNTKDNVFKNIYCTWLGGLSTTEDADVLGEFVKWMTLILVIILIFSALNYAQFPENAIFRGMIAGVVGVLATLLITTQEILTMMQGYRAMGVALTVFMPILILGFFTLVVSTKANPFGILLQKILWIVFSVYLFLKTWIIFAATQGWTSGFIHDFLVMPFTNKVAWEELLKTTGAYDVTMLVIMLITSVSIFVICVIGNKKFLVHWLAHEKMMAELEAEEEILKRSEAYDKARAKQMQNVAKKV